jgi:hypothetical protein
MPKEHRLSLTNQMVNRITGIILSLETKHIAGLSKKQDELAEHL